MKDNFIEIYDNAIPDKLCDDLINTYKLAEEYGYTYDRQNYSNKVDSIEIEDNSISLPYVPLQFIDSNIINQFNELFWKCYTKYANKYSILNKIGYHKMYGIKIQKTEPSQGYHTWHCEQGTKENSARILAWAVYLNDISDGGETEFLYQSQRVIPKKGTAMIFPASFTHTHRGNPPLTETKYIVTGWIEF